MNARRYLIRTSNRGVDNWFTEQVDPAELAKQVFDLGAEEQSVYEVEAGQEECVVVAGLWLTNYKHDPAKSTIRMLPEDLELFGISLGGLQFGTTGIPWVDGRHRNLEAEKDQLISLTRRLHGLCCHGHDRVRRIERGVVLRTLARVCGWPDDECPPHVKSLGRWVPDRKAGRMPRPTPEAVREELRHVRFEDELIQPGAGRRSSGDRYGDWMASLNDLRQEYTAEYLREVSDRFDWPRSEAKV